MSVIIRLVLNSRSMETVVTITLSLKSALLLVSLFCFVFEMVKTLRVNGIAWTKTWSQGRAGLAQRTVNILVGRESCTCKRVVSSKA